MVDRFLCWRLPEDFRPDNGISFKPTFNDHLPTPTKCNPVGTNLLDATQATAMVRHMIEGLPATGGQRELQAEWLPIESAPRDGTVILLGHEHAAFSGWWTADAGEGAGGWVDGCAGGYDDELITYHPTHWMPLPARPTALSHQQPHDQIREGEGQ